MTAHALARPDTAPGLRILLVTSAHDGLSQRLQTALRQLGHRVAVEVVRDGAELASAVRRHAPELVVCPRLEVAIPERVAARVRCLVLHGPASLDWAIEHGQREWGVIVLERDEVRASRRFALRNAAKDTLLRHDVRRAAVEAVVEALTARGPGGERLDVVRPALDQAERAIDWRTDTTETVLRRLRAADGAPGVLDAIAGTPFHLFGAHPEGRLRGAPGAIVAQRHDAICRATIDGAVWISQLERPGHFKLPAARALALAGHPVKAPEVPGFREIAYGERGGVGFLRFEFYDGAMSTRQARRLLAAYRAARARDTRVIVLLGGADFFSTGIHLNLIEAADDPAAESWWNLHAIDDLVREVIETDDKLVVSALEGDVAAGGVPLAVAADHVMAGEDVVLNPYYRHMGGLYGSEYWTYLLPRRVGPDITARLTSAPYEPVGADRAAELGLVDATVPAAAFHAEVRRAAEALAADPALPARLRDKRRFRARDEQRKPLAAYRAEELARCRECLFGRDRSYHRARRRFVYTR
jgi:putative two-component system hydrogenase maturation factor HypX/HoxX